MITAILPLSAIIFAAVVLINFAMSHGEEWSPDYFVGALLVSVLITAVLLDSNIATSMPLF